MKFFQLPERTIDNGPDFLCGETQLHVKFPDGKLSPVKDSDILRIFSLHVLDLVKQQDAIEFYDREQDSMQI